MNELLDGVLEATNSVNRTLTALNDVEEEIVAELVENRAVLHLLKAQESLHKAELRFAEVALD